MAAGSRGVPDPVAVLRGHSGEVQCLDFDETERYLITGDSHGEVWVWDLQDLRPLVARRLHSLSAGVLGLRHLPGRRQLLTQGRDGTAFLWTLNESMQPSEQPVRSFIRAAYSFCRCSLLLEDSGSRPASLTGTDGYSNPAASAQGLAAVGGDGAAGTVTSQAAGVSTDDETGGGPLVGAGQTPAGDAWRETAATTAAQPELPCLRNCVETNENAVLLAMADDEAQDPQVWCCCCGRLLAHLRQDAVGGAKLGMVLALRLYRRTSFPGSVYLAAGYENGGLVVWDVGAGASGGGVLLAYRKLFAEPVMAVDVEAGGDGGICGAAEDKLLCFSVDYSAGSLGVRHSIDLKRQGISDAAVRQDGRVVATAGWDGRTRIYKKSSGRPLAILKYHSQAVTALAFSPRTMMLATASRDKTVALWDLFPPGS